MWKLLFEILAVLLAGGVIVYVVKGIIDKRKLQQAMMDNEFREVCIDMIDKHARKVKLKDLQSGKLLEVQGEGVSIELHEGQEIYA